jgi:hypothetical protein
MALKACQGDQHRLVVLTRAYTQSEDSSLDAGPTVRTVSALTLFQFILGKEPFPGWTTTAVASVAFTMLSVTCEESW